MTAAAGIAAAGIAAAGIAAANPGGGAPAPLRRLAVGPDRVAVVAHVMNAQNLLAARESEREPGHAQKRE
jgi:hypothetical protein